MSPVKESESETKKLLTKPDAILEGAMQEFLEHGYAGTSMDRVAATARVSKATVYNHFQDKEGLFSALVQRLAEKKFAEVLLGPGREAPSQVSLTELRQLLVRLLARQMDDQDHLTFARLILGESGRFPELAQIFVRNLVQPGIALLTQYLSACSEITLQDPEAVARVVLGALVHFTIVQEMLHGSELVPMSRDRLINTIMAMVVDSATPPM